MRVHGISLIDGLHAQLFLHVVPSAHGYQRHVPGYMHPLVLSQSEIENQRMRKADETGGRVERAVERCKQR